MKYCTYARSACIVSKTPLNLVVLEIHVNYYMSLFVYILFVFLKKKKFKKTLCSDGID